MRLFGGGGRTAQSDMEVGIDAVAEAITSGSHTLVDVRERDEWQAGHIGEAIHIPLGELSRRLGELDRTKPVYTICLSGSRSLLAAQMMVKAGFPDVKSMQGGMAAWARAGKPYI